MQCDLGDSAIFYESYGSSRPIVMLPGRPSDHRVMEQFMEPLFAQRDGWLRLYPDLPGTGRTPSVDRLATHDQVLDTMLAFIDAVIPGQRFVLAGLSYGGYLARGVIYHKAASIDGVMLCAPQVKADPAQARLPKRTALVEDPQLQAELGPGAGLVGVQSPTVVEAVRDVLAEVQIADHAFNERLEGAAPFSFDMDRLPDFPPPLLLPRSC
jgi:pimeloyl-ACP methyl ester carboxylesterase